MGQQSMLLHYFLYGSSGKLCFSNSSLIFSGLRIIRNRKQTDLHFGLALSMHILTAHACLSGTCECERQWRTFVYADHSHIEKVSCFPSPPPPTRVYSTGKTEQSLAKWVLKAAYCMRARSFNRLCFSRGAGFSIIMLLYCILIYCKPPWVHVCTSWKAV